MSRKCAGEENMARLVEDDGELYNNINNHNLTWSSSWVLPTTLASAHSTYIALSRKYLQILKDRQAKMVFHLTTYAPPSPSMLKFSTNDMEIQNRRGNSSPQVRFRILSRRPVILCSTLVQMTRKFRIGAKFHRSMFVFEFCPNGIKKCPNDVRICPSDKISLF